MQKETNQKRSGKKGLTIVLSVLVGILVIIGVLTALMFNDPNISKMNSKITPSDEFTKKILTASVTGAESSATADEVNSFLEGRRLENNTISSGHGLTINRIIVSFREDNTADAYLPVEFKTKHFGVSVHFTPSYDAASGQLVMHVLAVKIGQLPVNPEWLFAYFKEILPSEFSIKGTDIQINASIFKLTYAGVTAELKISNLRIEKGLLKVKAKSNLNIPLLGITS